MIGAVADLVVAVGGVVALMGAVGGSLYIAQRKRNGQSAIPGAAHDEEISALRDIENAIREGTEQTSQEHASMMHAMGFREGHHWVPRDRKEGS